MAHYLDSVVVGCKVGSKTAFVAHVGGHIAGFEHTAEVVEHFGTHAQSFGEGGSTHRHDHELLEVDAVVGMGTTVEDVHHGDGKHVGSAATEVAVELLTRLHGCSLGAGEGDAEDGVGTETAFVGCAVHFNHLLVDGALLFDVHAAKLLVEDVVDIVDGLQDTFAHVDGFVVVAKFTGFVYACGGS